MKPLAAEILTMAYGLNDELTNIRRDLHTYPELGFEETRTAQKIAEYLSKLDGVVVETGIGKTGVTGVLKCKKDAPTVALRADMDALPMQEENDVPYQSKIKDVMHACGHDGHVAILLGAASILSTLRDQLSTHVKFIFQPAEESSLGGAQVMIKDKVLEKDKVTAIYGFHINATSDFGQVGVLEGPVMAGVVRFTIVVHGKAGHSAYPESCVDPILVVNNIYNALQTIHNNIHAADACLISVSAIHAGSKSGIPEKAEMSGVVSALDKNVEKVVLKRMQEIVTYVGQAFHAECSINFEETYLPTFNSPELCDVIRKAAVDLTFPVTKIKPSMGSDDFSYFLDKIPGAYMTFGIRKGDDFPIAHTTHFDFDETILSIGAAMLAKCILLSE